MMRIKLSVDFVVNRGVRELVSLDKLLVATLYLLVSWLDFMSLFFFTHLWACKLADTFSILRHEK